MSASRQIRFEDYCQTLLDYHARPGAQPFPRPLQQRLLLLYSLVQRFEEGQPYTEVEVQEEIQTWVEQYGGFLDADSMTLRRYLVDLGFLDRNPSGTIYARIQGYLEDCSWDPRILECDESSLLKKLTDSREDAPANDSKGK